MTEPDFDTESDEPLETYMEAHQGRPMAVAMLLRTGAKAIETMPDDMTLNVEIEVWESEARDE